MTETLALSTIRLDGETQPRTTIDQEVVDDYAASYGFKPPNLPPLTVFHDGVNWWLADGFHRWHAAKKAGLDKIPCEVLNGSKEDAQWYAVAANQTHGLRRSNADKAKAVKVALKHPKGAKMSDRKIAEYVGVTDKTVAKYRAELEGRSEIPNAETRTDTAGREQPARKPRESVDPDGTDIEPCPDCGGTDFHKDGTCASCIQEDAPEPTVEELMAASNKALESLARQITGAHKLATELETPHVDEERLGILQSQLRTAAGTLRAAKGDSTCSYCEGEGCKVCMKCGWLTRTQAESAPEKITNSGGQP